MRLKISLFLGFCLAFVAFRTLDDPLFYVPQNWEKPVYNFDKNPLTEQNVLLGRALFYDPLLSTDHSISCASCHSPFSAFTHIDHAVSHGIDNRLGTRNSPTLMNLAWQRSFMWDGAINHLDVQALAPIAHPDEMASSIDTVVHRLNRSKLYRKLFFKAYNDSLATGEKTLKALSQFMLTLISANSKYDKVMRKEASFTPQELNGYAVFKKNCASCHKEPLFSSDDFANNGLPIDTDYKDWGRMKVTKRANDSLKFKIPTLRNIEYSYPYMHDGRFKRLSEVINHYIKGIQKSPTLAVELQEPLLISPTEKVDLIAFLFTLSDKDFVFNKKNQYPRDELLDLK